MKNSRFCTVVWGQVEGPPRDVAPAWMQNGDYIGVLNFAALFHKAK